MLQVNVQVTNISGERLWEAERQLPPQVQIAVNVNLLDISQASDGTLNAPFVFTVNFVPSIAYVNIKGTAKITGDDDERKKIVDEHKQQKAPPMQLVNAVSNVAMADAILVCRSLNVPPPLPMFPAATGTAPAKAEHRYTS